MPPRHSESLSRSGSSAPCQDQCTPSALFPFSWERKMIPPPPAPSEELTSKPTGLKKALLIGIQGMAPEGAQPFTSSPSLMKKSKAKTTALSLAKKLKAEHMPEDKTHPQSKEPLGRHLDAIEMRRILIELYGYKAENVKLLIDGENPGGLLPTKENILTKLDELVHGAQPGDSFFFHFSGQSVEKSADGTDKESAMSQVIVTYDNQTIDDAILKEKLIARLPAGSRLTAVFDTCHSAPMLDLKHYRCNRAYVPWADKSDSTPPMRYDVKCKPRLPYCRGNASGTSASQHPNACSIQSTASVDHIWCAADQQSESIKGGIRAPLSVAPSSDTSRDMWLSLEDRIRRSGVCGEQSPIERGSPPMDLLRQGWCKLQPNQKTVESSKGKGSEEGANTDTDTDT
ncbi:hypothetical protein FA13DRAFT_293209 [Coprinellus micaceus]|uniref:Peptidase C14 caspase domain-containing protein n=1 Tax=Coprinellus micaceus TaxID=71717 RepID=A0A4Y7TE31_COPMI|nr:hypothetical protein FA13DRAFT_293209 [Coprinellus micaceus]